MSIEALGIYYFAFNAGLGISLGIITSIKSALLPHLCNARDNLSQFRSRYFSSLKTIALVIVPMVLLQSSLAPIYLPIVFGDKWINAIPVLMLICLSAIPRPFADSASQLLLAVDKPEIDLIWNVFIYGIICDRSIYRGILAKSRGSSSSLNFSWCLSAFVHNLGNKVRF